MLLISGGNYIKDNQIQSCVKYAKIRAKTVHELIKSVQ